MNELVVVVPGVPVSGNHSKYGSGRLTKEAREYDARIRSLTKAAVILQGWVIPYYVGIHIETWNTRIDWDNAAKEIQDPMQGIAFEHDSRVLSGHVDRWRDNNGPRVVIRVRPFDGTTRGYPKK